MMERVARSVRAKLLLLLGAVTAIALVISAIALLTYEARTYQNRWAQDLSAQADILGISSSAAIAFEDARVARENLLLLRSRPAILAAALYDEHGRLFASFVRDADQPHPPAVADKSGMVVDGELITLVKPIVDGSSFVGSVYLRATYGLADRIRSYAAILFAVFVLSLFAAVAIGIWLQRKITEPIVAVAETAHQVINTRDFSLRVQKTTSDEIGYLVDAFNTMLAEIGARSEALITADRMKDQFLATLAHELRNPLAPMSNALHLMRVAPDRPEIMESAKDMLERQLRQIVRLVDDLLDVSRITTGKLTLRKEIVSLQSVLANAIEIARPLVDSRGHSLRVDLPRAEILLDADSARLAQVFSNLLNNAAKYTDEGGAIDVRAVADNGSVTVDVVDNGVGIAPELLPEVFKMFTQLDSSIERRVQSGLGVGLALSRRLIEMHGGDIEAVSEGRGRGCCFRVRLPMVLAYQPAEVSTGEAPADAGPQGLRVLIIDDNVDFANSLAVILREMRHDVVVAHDGPAGVDRAREMLPDIAFVDIGLPTMNGYDVARLLRAQPPRAGMLLVAVTGWGQEGDRAQAMAAGFDLHLVKPLDVLQLPEVLRMYRNKFAPDVATPPPPTRRGPDSPAPLGPRLNG